MNNNLCVSEIHSQTNKRISDRNIPSQTLQPYIDVRPVMTKYSYFPIVDPRKTSSIKMQVLPTFNIEKTFNPGNTTSPWSGFATNVNTESELRNQIYALQRCSQSVYVPQSNSDLYTYKFTPTTSGIVNNNSNAHNLLFENTVPVQTQFQSPMKKGEQLFMNSTRTQINLI